MTAWLERGTDFLEQGDVGVRVEVVGEVGSPFTTFAGFTERYARPPRWKRGSQTTNGCSLNYWQHSQPIGYDYADILGGSLSIFESSQSTTFINHGGPIVISPDEYVLIIRGWLANESELFLSASMLGFSAFSKCKVVEVSGGKIKLRSVNPEDPAVFAFSIESPLLSLGYAEPREMQDLEALASIPEGNRLKSALTLSVPVGAVNPSLSDEPFIVGKIILMEL